MKPHSKFRLSLIIGLAIAMLGLAGFASRDANAGTLPKDPCALLRPAEIQALAPNDKIGSGVPDTGGAPMAVMCTYSWGSRNTEWGQTSLAIEFTDVSKVWPGGLSPDDIKQRVTVETNMGGPGSSPISGIGDCAVFSTDPKAHEATAKAYMVQGKGIVMWLTYHGGDALSQKDKIIALLKQAATRL